MGLPYGPAIWAILDHIGGNLPLISRQLAKQFQVMQQSTAGMSAGKCAQSTSTRHYLPSAWFANLHTIALFNDSGMERVGIDRQGSSGCEPCLESPFKIISADIGPVVQCNEARARARSMNIACCLHAQRSPVPAITENGNCSN